MKKIFKIVTALLILLLLFLVVFHYSSNEDLPKGKTGTEADALAYKMLKAINNNAYKNTQFIEWSFRNKHFYKWNKTENIVEVSWDDTYVSLHTKEPIKSKVLINGVKKVSPDAIQKAINYFNNDSFWLIAPHKVFEKGIIRSIVNFEDKAALLITYTTGGSTPGDSYLWILDETGLPIKFKMWVSIIPTGGMEATWSDWVTTETGALLPKSHKLSIGTINLGPVKAFNKN
ncbi:hypothetical protein OAT18_01915 [Tenacibaculum sp.]|nr:hypothetical protein [Tenacibaculum sp.]